MSGPASSIILAGAAQPARPWPRYALTRPEWQALVEALPAEPALTLQGLWADTAQVHALFVDPDARSVLLASCPVEGGGYPALSPASPAAAWFERMLRDLWGHRSVGGLDARPWLDHGHWGIVAPMAARPAAMSAAPEPAAFLTTEGDDLHQIAVGPVHAGIIEPGHFRFTAQGELVARLEARLGYAHKGTLALLRGKPPRTAARFAARLSGDATVAHAVAFAAAAEAALGTEPPPRAHALRAVMAEWERIANHLGDVGAIINDAALALPFARFGWHREALLRAAAIAFGHRLMMDCVVPGGVASDIAPGGPERLLATLEAMQSELPALLALYDDHAGLVDRMADTGRVTPALAAVVGAGGVVGRASGRAADARLWPGYQPYPALNVAVPVLQAGDVDARVRIRLAEIGESALLLRVLLADLPQGAVAVPLPGGDGEGMGVAESFRGEVWHWLRIEGGLIAAAFARDPSWLHWPLLQAAVADNIVADFPLINRSFNASYSGVDL